MIIQLCFDPCSMVRACTGKTLCRIQHSEYVVHERVFM